MQEILDQKWIDENNIVLKSYPNDESLDWTIETFGPLYIPKKGSSLKMTALNKLLYGNVIEWEQKKKLTLKGDSVLLGDSLIHNYRFRENYYFVSGDEMMNSQDSRYWGLLPEPYIIGRAVLIWKSIDRMADSLRWKRILRKVK